MVVARLGGGVDTACGIGYGCVVPVPLVGWISEQAIVADR
jgi:hypothetical protein